MLRHGIGLDSIKAMKTDDEVQEYLQILQAFDEIEAEQMEKQ